MEKPNCGIIAARNKPGTGVRSSFGGFAPIARSGFPVARTLEEGSVRVTIQLSPA